MCSCRAGTVRDGEPPVGCSVWGRAARRLFQRQERLSGPAGRAQPLLVRLPALHPWAALTWRSWCCSPWFWWQRYTATGLAWQLARQARLVAGQVGHHMMWGGARHARKSNPSMCAAPAPLTDWMAGPAFHCMALRRSQYRHTFLRHSTHPTMPVKPAEVEWGMAGVGTAANVAGWNIALHTCMTGRPAAKELAASDGCESAGICRLGSVPAPHPGARQRQAGQHRKLGRKGRPCPHPRWHPNWGRRGRTGGVLTLACMHERSERRARKGEEQEERGALHGAPRGLLGGLSPRLQLQTERIPEITELGARVIADTERALSGALPGRIRASLPVTSASQGACCTAAPCKRQRCTARLPGHTAVAYFAK